MPHRYTAPISQDDKLPMGLFLFEVSMIAEKEKTVKCFFYLTEGSIKKLNFMKYKFGKTKSRIIREAIDDLIEKNNLKQEFLN